MRPVAYSRVYPLLLALCLAFSLAGCATTAATLPPEEPAMHSVSEVQDEYVVKGTDVDPWVGFNRSVYKFNYHLDKYVLLPVVTGYEFITPTLVQDGVSNVFSNLLELRNLSNCIFQLKGTQTLTTLGRFLTNSTLGLGGLFDVATNMGMAKQAEDFGQTLGYWGLNPGPYMVLPLFGPSNVRDTGGIVVDAGIRYAITSVFFNSVGNMSDGTENTIKNSMTVLEAIDKRHLEKFRYYGSDYPFEYEMVRFLAAKQRELQVIK